MVHELLTINNSRVKLADTDDDKPSEVVLNSFSDDFFQQHQMSNFGDLGVAVKQLVETYSSKRGKHSNIQSIEDMQNFVENYGDYMKSSTVTSKHVSVLTELSEMVSRQNLLEISALEQDIATSQNMSKHYEKITGFISNPRVAFRDCLRLVILYALRYERESNSNIARLREQLRSRDRGQFATEVRYVDLIVNTCGKTFRTGDLFGNESTSARFLGALKGLKGVDNIYTQHTPYLEKLLNGLMKNSLNQSHYPLVDPRLDKKTTPTDILVFIVGGATYEEAMLVRNLSQSSRTRILLGGSCIHNSKSFLADVSNASNYHISEDYTAVDMGGDGEPDLI